MAAKKVYAVRRGKIIGILDSWDACKEAVDGYPGAEYKSFKTLEEARAYMEGAAYTMESSAQGTLHMEEIEPLPVGADDDNRTFGRDMASGEGRAAGKGKTAGKRKAFSDRENRPRGMGDPAGGLVAYVDGSYEHSVKRYAFGCVFILPDDTVYVENGSGSNPDTAKLRNVSGEMLGPCTL